MASQIKEIPIQLFDKQRKQWKSNDILRWVSNQYKLDRLTTTKILSICDFDAYSNTLNFVFGEAFIEVYSNLSFKVKTRVLWIKT
jgi:predicted Zn-dependent protease